MSQTDKNVDVLFGANSSHAKVDNLTAAKSTRKRTMTAKGLDYTTSTTRRIALTKEKKCGVKLNYFRFLLSTSRNQYEIENELQSKMVQLDAAFQCLKRIV